MAPWVARGPGCRCTWPHAPPKTGGKHEVLKAQENLHGQTSQSIAESTLLSPLTRIEANSAFGF